MGEGMDDDRAIMPFISSVNIACGYHAGDADTMKRTVEWALEHGIAIGAHPSYPDREHFGRIDLPDLSTADLSQILTDQLGILRVECDLQAATLHHVKLHGALYNRAARDQALSAFLCEAIRQFDPSLLVYGLSGSVMQAEAERCGLRFINETFSDRTYQEDGSLTPRTRPDALIGDPALAVRQVLDMVREGRVMMTSGRFIALVSGTICIHGDGFHALAFAKAIHEALVNSGILIKAPGSVDGPGSTDAF